MCSVSKMNEHGQTIDFALLLDCDLTLSDKSALRADLQQALGVDGIDLVFLRSADAIVRFEVLYGRRLVCCELVACAALPSLPYQPANTKMKWRNGSEPSAFGRAEQPASFAFVLAQAIQHQF